MAINIRCKCGGESKLTAKRCSRCNEPFPKHGRRYKITLRCNGKKVTRTVSSLALAREIEGKLKVDIARGEHGIRRKHAPTVGKVWARYLPWAQEHKKSWRSDKYIFQKHIAPVFGNTPLDKISQLDVERLILAMKRGKSQHGRPYALATIKHVVVLLSRLFNVAIQWGMYDGKNPCKTIKPFRLNNQLTEFLSKDEITALLNVLDSWPVPVDAAFVKFLLYTGLRRGELFNLQWKDVDLERQTITLRDPKGKHDVTLPLSDKAVQVLSSIPKTDSPYVFPGKSGKKRVDFKRPWARIKEEAGLPPSFRLHGLRHHFASSLVSAGVDLYTVSKLLTHKDVKTTMRYAHLADKALRDAVKLSDELQAPQQTATIINLDR